MKTIDLTHPMSPGMPVYPGTEPPTFETVCTIENSGFAEKKMNLYSHTGTHMDAPAHIIGGAKTLDSLPVEHFIGPGIVINLNSPAKRVLDIEDLKSYEKSIEKSEFVLLHTGWDRLWGKDAYFKDYPALSSRAAEWMGQFGLKGIGVDMISVDEAGNSDFSIHKIFLNLNIVIIENLTNLGELLHTDFIFSCLPLKTEEADGSPVRAVAFTPPPFSDSGGQKLRG